MNNLQLSFVTGDPASYLAALAGTASTGKRKVLLRPWGDDARAVVALATRERMTLQFFASPVDGDPLDSGVSAAAPATGYDAIFLFHQDPVDLSAHLLDYLDLPDGHVVAPKTAHYFESRPLFLISIPKSGTHLLYELAEAFGYRAGIVCPEQPLGGHWYCVEYSNSHTVARDFFVDTVRRSPFGNRHHPFPRCPALFIYRNPLDIVVSEANYYHRDGASLFAGYLANKSFEERLYRLIDDPWLLGSIRDRIAGFAPWLEFPNVVPVSFEELIGPNGGGALEVQTRLIWSLQLKLHVPGSPGAFGNRVFNRESATFHAGRIGAHVEAFTKEASGKFSALPQDFMDAFGYAMTARPATPTNSNLLSSRTEEFRKRPLTVSSAVFDDVPIAVLPNYLRHNIVLYRSRYIAVPQSAGPVDIAEALAANPDAFPAGPDLASVQRAVLLLDTDIQPVIAHAPPRLVQSLENCNVVFFQGNYFVVPKALGSINLELEADRTNPEIRFAGTLAEAVALAGTTTPLPDSE